MDRVSRERLEDLFNLCSFYKSGVYDMKEFQSRLGTALAPEPETKVAYKLEEILGKEYDALEELEGAIYAFGEEKAVEVADRIINAITQLQQEFNS